VAGALVVTALLGVATFGGLNYVAARDLLVDGAAAQLTAVGSSRAQAIDAGAARLSANVSAVAADLAVADALRSLTEAFAALGDERLDADERAVLAEQYQTRAVDPLNEAGLGPYDVADLLPRTAAGQWLQYHYTVRASDEPPPVDAGDGTEYSVLNAAVTPYFEALSESQYGGDLLLVDREGFVVYSLDKRNDVGTNLDSGPYADSALARVVTETLPRTRVGETVLTSFGVSPTGRTAMYAVSAVSEGSEVLGALAIEIPVAVLNGVVSSDGAWDQVGLGDGDVYIVGADQRLQSEPRAFVEGPEPYMADLAGRGEAGQEEARLTELFGSPVGIQVVDTVPVRTALSGDSFSGTARSVSGGSVYAAAQPLNVSGQQWVVVTEVPRDAVLAPLTSYIGAIALVLAIVLPLVALLGVWLARRITRPIRPTVAAAEAIVAGDRSPNLDTSRRDEFGDLARRLTAVASTLAEQEQQLADEYERTRGLLLSVLPTSLVRDDGSVDGTGEVATLATVVAVTVVPAGAGDDPTDVTESLAQASARAESLASDLGLQRIRVSADRYLLVAGIGREDAGADDALEFAAQLRDRLLGEAEAGLDVHLGLSSGAVATGVLDSGALTFGAWGDPVRRALALASLADLDAVLVDASTAELCSADRWELVPAHDIVDLDGRPMNLMTLRPEDAIGVR
jgi:class 3 adenylate cyclase